MVATAVNDQYRRLGQGRGRRGDFSESDRDGDDGDGNDDDDEGRFLVSFADDNKLGNTVHQRRRDSIKQTVWRSLSAERAVTSTRSEKYHQFLLLDEAVALRAVFVIVFESDGKTGGNYFGARAS